MSKDTNKQTAEKLFASTTHDVLFANKKGEFFTSENIASLSIKEGEKLEKFERPVEKETAEVATVKPKTAEVATVKPKTAEVLIAEAKNIATIAMVELAKDVEVKGKNRTTVIAAFDERIAELTANIEVTGTTTETGANGNEDTATQK